MLENPFKSKEAQIGMKNKNAEHTYKTEQNGKNAHSKCHKQEA